MERRLLRREASVGANAERRTAVVFRKVGEVAAREGVGLVFDTVLMGVNPGRLAFNEVTASTLDVGVAKKLSKGETDQTSVEEENQKSRWRKVGGKAVQFAIPVTTAVLAQRYGPELAEHISDRVNDGFGGVATPLASKLGAISGVNKATKIISRAISK